MATAAVVDRFWSYIDTSGGPGACWPWIGAQGPEGYGLITIDGTCRRAHRWLLGQLRGEPLRWDREVRELACHRCDNPACCNPTHLYIGDRASNIRDMVERGRARNANMFKTHCPRGHEYSGSNVYVYPDGGRSCRACHRDFAKASRARQKRVG